MTKYKNIAKLWNKEWYRMRTLRWLRLHSQYIPDKMYLRAVYKLKTGRILSLKSPKLLTEKIQWLKLYDRRTVYQVMVDKVRVKDWVANKIGAQYVIPLLGVWEDPHDINFDKLPEKFVLKCNHNSGQGMYICRDKSLLDKESVINALLYGLQQDYYLHGREWPYKNIRHLIIAEEYIEDTDGKDLIDYKVHCFNGIPKMIDVHLDRFHHHRVIHFTTDWRQMDFIIDNDPVEHGEIPDKPICIDELLMLSQSLSENIPYLRTDFYIVQNRIYFGECTLYQGNGWQVYKPKSYDRLLGDWLVLPSNIR